MIAVGELADQKCTSREVLEPLAILISPFAPHIAEELWSIMGHKESISFASFPEYKEEYTVENSMEYPVSFNGKLRFKITLPKSMTPAEVEAAVRADERTPKYLVSGQVRKIIVVPGKIINVVC